MRLLWLTTAWDALYHQFDMPLSPEWAKLPKRHCDECGKLYKQVRPRREGEHGFCADNCRKLFHKHQGAYSKLKGDMQKMVTREMATIEKRLREIIRQEIADVIVNTSPTAGGIYPYIRSAIERDANSLAAQRANR